MITRRHFRCALRLAQLKHPCSTTDINNAIAMPSTKENSRYAVKRVTSLQGRALFPFVIPTDNVVAFRAARNHLGGENPGHFSLGIDLVLRQKKTVPIQS